MAGGLKILCSLQTAVLEKDARDDNGKIIAKAGDTVVILPQTAAQAVLVEKDKSLADVWPELCRTNHNHPGLEEALAGYQAELIRLTNRITALEPEKNTGE